MEQRVDLITLGVRSMERARAFYARLGFAPHPRSLAGWTVYQMNGFALALFALDELAQDASLPLGELGFKAMTLAYNVAGEAEVDETLREAEAAGARIVRKGEKVFWGGYRGYFADPDGYRWEIAMNPGPIGQVVLPDEPGTS